MKSCFEAIIVGAGVFGALTARELTRYRLRVALVEKEMDVSFGTTASKAGSTRKRSSSTPSGS